MAGLQPQGLAGLAGSLGGITAFSQAHQQLLHNTASVARPVSDPSLLSLSLSPLGSSGRQPLQTMQQPMAGLVHQQAQPAMAGLGAHAGLQVLPRLASMGSLGMRWDPLQANSSAAAAAAAAGGQKASQRAFVGVVSKLQDNYGFVDDDVFFQTRCALFLSPSCGTALGSALEYKAVLVPAW